MSVWCFIVQLDGRWLGYEFFKDAIKPSTEMFGWSVIRLKRRIVRKLLTLKGRRSKKNPKSIGKISKQSS